jgi:imidazolonepropionase-like amidohydrolase
MALDFAKEQELKIVIVGGKDAPRLADRLSAEGVAVILDGVLDLPSRSWEPYDAVYSVAAQLHEAGVKFCISTGGSGFGVANLRNLPYEAAMAAAFGLPAEEALKSVTLHPAQILGIGDRLGSIDVGKDANLIVTTGDPLEIMTNVVMAWIEGEGVDLGTRHTDLYDKYRNRPRRDGKTTGLQPSSGSGR